MTDISNGPRKAKFILFVALDVNLVEVINNVIVDHRLNVFADDTRESRGSILGRGRALNRSFINCEYR